MKMQQMCFIACLVGSTLSSSVYGEPVTLTIPGKGWLVSFDAPSIISFDGMKGDKGFRYRGVSQSGFNVSIFVEEKKGEETGHKACADHYWPLARRNPMIDQSTVVSNASKDFVQVSYRHRGKQDGTKFDIPNIHLYFEHDGKWVDIHISKFPFEKTEQEILDGFVKSLKYETVTRHKAANTGSLPASGTR